MAEKIVRRARSKDPRAREPIWYLKVHSKALPMSESPGIPSSSGMSFLEKYHVHVEIIITRSLAAIRKNESQKIPKYM